MTVNNIITPNFKPNLHDNMQDHVWVLFLLADISKYFEERDLPQVAAVIKETIFNVETEVLSPASETKVFDSASPVQCAGDDLSNNVHS